MNAIDVVDKARLLDFVAMNRAIAGAEHDGTPDEKAVQPSKIVLLPTR